MFSKVLVANRGEIAVRVMRSLREMGIACVAVYSEADRQALHVRTADEAYCVGPAPSAQSYLRIDKIIEVAKASGAEAIHPGYGFLSENADFARACQANDITFIGPRPRAIEAMGEKVRARAIMSGSGVPLVPGTEAMSDPQEALAAAREMGFPVLIKASAGGGGKGMRRVDDPAGFEAAFRGAQREAGNAFGNDEVYVEKFVVRPKHVEIQILADTHGNTVHLFERDCSVQRRHQKVIEETPCPVLSEEVRQKMGEAAIMAAEAVDYVGAGTVEFLLDVDQNFYFLEMNTRLQVEHPITEMITGIDLVRMQLKVAAGEELPFKQADLERSGAAIECRIYAEDPEANFMPSPGHIEYLMTPSGPWVREDSGVYRGAEVPVHYDPMIAKLVVWAETREHAIQRMRRALKEYVVVGIRTNVAFHEWCLTHEAFAEGGYDTGFIDAMLAEGPPAHPPGVDDLAELAAVLARHIVDEDVDAAPKSANGAKTNGVVSRWKQMGRFRQLRRFAR